MDAHAQLRLILLGGTATTLLTKYLMNHRLKGILKTTPNLHPKDLPKVFQSAGIEKDFPTIPIKKLENAYYATPGESKSIIRGDKKGILSEELKEKIRQVGHIGYDPKFNKAGIIAHEAGHAAIRTTKPWNDPSRLNQSVFRTLGGLAMPLSGMAGVATGLGTHNPLYGALAGLGTAGVLSIPTLVNEAQATGYARRYLDQSTHNKGTKKQNNKALNTAYATYVVGSLLGPTLAGGLSGTWAHLTEPQT